MPPTLKAWKTIPVLALGVLQAGGAFFELEKRQAGWHFQFKSNIKLLTRGWKGEISLLGFSVDFTVVYSKEYFVVYIVRN